MPAQADERHFRYRLFASVDLSGSTAFKVRSQDKEEEWAIVFRNFFEDFPVCLAEELAKIPANFCAGCSHPAPMRVWKFIGDEILFVAELLRHEHVVYHTLAFRNALTRYSEELRSRRPGARLGLKGAVWGAGFPVGNTEVNTALMDSEKRTLLISDYIGPSIDLGFRLARHADARRIPVSADVALMIAYAAVSEPAMLAVPVMFEEPLSLPGIAEGVPYPLISIDRNQTEQSPEDKVLGRKRRCTHENLRVYLTGFFDRALHGIRKPFIEGDVSPHFGTVPADVKLLRDKRFGEDAASQGTPPKPSEEGAKGTVVKPKDVIPPTR